MSDHGAIEGHSGQGELTHHGNYVRIWAILLGLLAVSVAGPLVAALIEHRPTALALTLSTAFGIAVVKAYMVAKNFMHINFTQRFVPYLVVTMVLLMLILFSGVAPDVMKLEGRNWVKPAWIAANVEAAAPHGAAHGGHAENAH
jgi:caa(3)-type oxidase subunit IV